MTANTSDDPAFASPLSPVVVQIMIALGDGERHGYAIMQEVEEYTGGKVVLAPGTLYRAIKRMLDTGLIEEVSDRTGLMAPESAPGPAGGRGRRGGAGGTAARRGVRARSSGACSLSGIL